MDKPIIIYGTRTCSDCIRTKHWLKRHNEKYIEFFLEDNDSYVEKVLQITNGDTRIPVIILPEGSILIEPNNEELEKELLK